MIIHKTTNAVTFLLIYRQGFTYLLCILCENVNKKSKWQTQVVAWVSVSSTKVLIWFK